MYSFDRNNKFRSFGFTLLELIVVLLLVSLALGIVAPRISVGTRKLSDYEFVMDVVKLLNRARLKAISRGSESIFFIDGANRKLGVDNIIDKKIPKNVDIYSKGLEQLPNGSFGVRFFPDGSATSTHLEITFDEKRQYFIIVNPLSGQIVIKNEKS